MREADYPQTWEAEGLTFPISYLFEPGAPEDGLTIDVPVATLNRVEADDFSWNVPGLREELVTSLLRSLPKNLRVNFVPAPNTAREFLAARAGRATSRCSTRWSATCARRPAWSCRATPGTGTKVPEHLRPTYRVVDDAGAEQARGKDLEALKAPLQPAFDAAIAEVAADVGLSATGQTTWTFGTVEESVVQRRAGHEVRGYPGARRRGRHGRARGVRLGRRGRGPAPARRHDACCCWGCAPSTRSPGSTTPPSWGWPGRRTRPSPSCVDDLRAAVAGSVVDAHPPVARPGGVRRARRGARRASSTERLAAVVADVLRVLAAWRQAEKRISGRAELLTLAAMQDMRAQVGRLVDRGFVGEAGPEQLRRYPTYLAAVEHRRERLDAQVARDAQLMDQVADVQEAYLHQVAALPAGRPPGAALRRVRWMLEEYRVSLWAQQLGTAYSRQRPAHPQGAARSSDPAVLDLGAVTDRPHHRPMTPGDRFFEAIEAGADPAAVAEAADRAATLIVRGARDADQEVVGERLLHLAETEGIETIAEVWSGAPADSLAGCLWRLYLLRQWVYADPVGVAHQFEAGRAHAPVARRRGRASPTRPAPTS